MPLTQPYLGYRYAQLANDKSKSTLKTKDGTFTAVLSKGTFYTNDVIFGGLLRYQNAFRVSGLELSAGLGADVAFGNKPNYTLMLEDGGNTTGTYSADYKGPGVLSSQAQLSAAYQFGPVQLGANVQFVLNDRLNTSLGAFANVEF